MEFSAENCQLQVNALSHEIPNQETSFVNEDIAITTEKIIEKPDSVVIEKQSIFNKKVIMKERKSYTKKSVASFPQSPLATSTNFFADERACFSYSEVCNQDNDEFSKMEISSQGSADSAMEISSQGSAMDISSLESASSQGSLNQDSGITPNNDRCIQNKGKVSKRKVLVDPAAGNLRKTKNGKIEKIKKLKVGRKKKDIIVKKGQNLKKKANLK